MSKSLYKEAILEKLRVIHEQEAMLEEILKQVERQQTQERKEEK